MSEFNEGDRVKILRPDRGRFRYSNVDYGYVIDVIYTGEDTQYSVEFQYKFLVHVDTFREEELSPA